MCWRKTTFDIRGISPRIQIRPDERVEHIKTKDQYVRFNINIWRDDLFYDLVGEKGWRKLKNNNNNKNWAKGKSERVSERKRIDTQWHKKQ